MNWSRRRALQAALGTLLFPAIARGQAAAGETLIRINIPGPYALPFLPIDIISPLNFDREAGARLVVRYQPSGVQAMEDVLAGNADLAALGFAPVPVLAARGKDVVAISPLSGRVPPVSIIVRKDLANTIRRIVDLKGRTIGTSTGSVNSRTYLQMLTQVLLSNNGVRPDQVRWLPTAQNWESISGALIGKACDAIVCEEPFSSRAVARKLGVTLASLSDPGLAGRVPGLGHIRTVVCTTRALVQTRPEKLETFVRMLRRTLVWIQTTAPEQVAQRAPAVSAEEREEISALLKKLPGIYSPDGRFDAAQIAATDVFLHAAMPEMKLAPAESLIDARWAGQRR